jgi:hypothetical protein
MKSLYIIILGLLTVLGVKAQTTTLFERTQTVLSPSERNYHSLQGDLDIKQQQQLYRNPAFYEVLYRNDSIFSTLIYNSVISMGYANGKQKGDYLMSEGNNFYDYRIMGNGEYNLPDYGTLFGSIQYAQGKHRNISWNSIRHPELYQPYLSTDTVGGDFKYEDYQASGGYSFRLGDYYLGFLGKFHGEQAHRVTDPRALINTTWLGFDLGVAKIYNGHLFMFQGGYERNKQHVKLSNYRPGQQDRFFILYGFGMYDVHQSTISFGYSRMFYINQGSASLTYLSPQNKRLSFYAYLGYKYNYVNTEESTSKNSINLYFTKTHLIEPTLHINYKVNPSFNLSLTASGTIDGKKGHENIFDRYLVDENYYVYDYRKINTQQNYNRTLYSGSVELKTAYQINKRQGIDVFVGASLSMREEKYLDQYKIKNQAILPHLGLGYHLNYKRSEWNIKGTYVYKHLLDNEYDVDIQNSSIEYLDFYHAFAPYAYNNNIYSSINLNASYIYHLDNSALGVNLKLIYKKGDRDEDTIYTKKLGFSDTTTPPPRISENPDKHNELWGSLSVFYMF